MENLPTVFGSNSKAQTAAKAVFDLAHRHGNILREGWKNIMDSMLQLFRSELLPKAMVEVSVPQAVFHVVSDQTTVHISMLCWPIFKWPSAFYGYCCPLLFSDGTFFAPQVEDFLEPNGKISLQREETPSNR